MARGEKHAGPARLGNQSDWQLYRRLLTYVRPYALFFVLSLLGYAVYSLGVVLLADLMQFLLDALGEPAAQGVSGSGLISGLVYSLFDVRDDERLSFARVAVPVALVLLTLLRALGFFTGSYFMSRVGRSLVHDLRSQRVDYIANNLSIPPMFGEETQFSILSIFSKTFPHVIYSLKL